MGNEQNQSSKRSDYIKNHFFWQDIIIGLLVIGAIVTFLIMSIDGFPADDRLNNATVTVAAEMAIKENLKSPSSAKFSDISIADKSNGNYRVTGHVEAENSFGAKIKNSFSVDINIKADNSFTYSNVNIN